MSGGPRAVREVDGPPTVRLDPGPTCELLSVLFEHALGHPAMNLARAARDGSERLSGWAKASKHPSRTPTASSADGSTGIRFRRRGFCRPGVAGDLALR